MRTPVDSRAAARRLIAALPRPLPHDETRRADAVQAALLASGLLDSSDLGNSPAVQAAARDGLTTLTHLLDKDAPGYGAGQLLLVLLAEPEAFAPHPAPDEDQLRARDAATALLHLALWHTDDPLHLLDSALQVHAPRKRATTTAPRRREPRILTRTAHHLTVRPGTRGGPSHVTAPGLLLPTGGVSGLAKPTLVCGASRTRLPATAATGWRPSSTSPNSPRRPHPCAPNVTPLHRALRHNRPGPAPAYHDCSEEPSV
ncbi:hypothetical protein [Streptomyces sp. NPDC015414]|uniref:hypothetical protein n=1 Tax=Streptomyces sp. NPDC015414 TaxID=3364957 RepID=UPI0036FE3816